MTSDSRLNASEGYGVNIVLIIVGPGTPLRLLRFSQAPHLATGLPGRASMSGIKPGQPKTGE